MMHDSIIKVHGLLQFSASSRWVFVFYIDEIYLELDQMGPLMAHLPLIFKSSKQPCNPAICCGSPLRKWYIDLL